MSTDLRVLGTTAQYAPVIKRSTGTLSTGLAVAIVADANQAGFVGDDVTGVAKFHIYKSSDTDRTVWALNLSTTPSTAPCSSTKAAVMSMAVDTSNNLHVVYQGTDNSLRYLKFTVSGGTWTAGTVQTVVAASAVTNRFRAVDIDIATAANPIVIAYESLASSGAGSRARVYVQLNDGTTWTMCHNYNIHATQFIRAGSEDVSISYNTTGPVSNVARVMIFLTRTTTTADQGDVCRDIEVNVNSGTSDGATVKGNWPVFNLNVAAGLRRGWIFKVNATVWQVAMVAGLEWPKFSVTRLTLGNYGTPTVNSTQSSPSLSTAIIPQQGGYTQLPRIYSLTNIMTAIGCAYNDNKVMFGYVTSNSPTYSTAAGLKTLAGLVFGYASSSSLSTSYYDNQQRPLDDYYVYGDLPVSVYGSCNTRTQSGDYKINFLAIYGYAGNTVDTTHKNKLRFLLNSYFDDPEVIAPSTTQANNTPTLQVRVQNQQYYPNVRGKIEWTLARDGSFVTDARTIIEPDSAYRQFGSTNNQAAPPISVSLAMTEAQSLYSGLWYIRARVVDDLGRHSAWSLVKSFSVSHPPVALPMLPSAGSLSPFGASGDTVFSWTFNDTESDDSQTAYQLVIDRVDTGANIVDTGKVASSIQSVIQNVSSTYLDIPLQWRVSLWDEDDVQGPFSDYILFTVSAAPTVVITSPTTGATVTSAMPTVTWSPTISGGRTQKAFKVFGYQHEMFERFEAVSASGWGTPTYGSAWVVAAGTAANFSKDATSGLISVNAVNTLHEIVNPVSLQDVEMTAEVTFTALALTQPYSVGFVFRHITVDDESRAIFTFNTDGTVTLTGQKVIGTVVTATSGTVVPSFTYAAATKYTIKSKIEGDTLVSKIWLSGAAEAIWQFTSSSFGYVVEDGQVGVRAFVNTGSTNTFPFVISFDNLSVRDVSQSAAFAGHWYLGSGGSYSFPSNIMSTDLPYSIQVTVQDTGGLTGTSSVDVFTDWVEPALGDITATTDDYGTTIAWTDANVDSDFVAWRIYRRYMVPAIAELDDSDTATTWVLVYETEDQVPSYSYKDYLTPLNKSTDYVVVQVADRFGSLVESNITSYSTVMLTADRYYFVPSVAIGAIASYEAVNVVADSYTDEVEQEVLHVIGRGRQVQIGDDLGVSGTLTIHLRNPSAASADMQFIQRLASSKTLNVYMKTPFGQVFYVKFGSIPVTRMAGVGTAELVDLQVPYVAVYGDVPVTRTS